MARAGSFRRAAELLHIAASAVNRQVSLLERSLGAALLERGRGRTMLRLTAAGEVLMKHARSAMKELDLARGEIEALKGLRIGSVRFGAAESFSRDFLPEFLESFHGRFPGISYRITIGPSPQLARLLLEDEIEVALVFNPRPNHAIDIAAKFPVRTFVMARRDHPLAGRAWVRLADCIEYPIVMPEPDTSVRLAYDEMFARLRAQPRSLVSTNSYEFLRSCARVGLGLAIVNHYLSERDAARDVVFIPIRDPLAPVQVLACCVRRGRSPSVAAITFLEKLKSALREKVGAAKPRRRADQAAEA